MKRKPGTLEDVWLRRASFLPKKPQKSPLREPPGAASDRSRKAGKNKFPVSRCPIFSSWRNKVSCLYRGCRSNSEVCLVLFPNGWHIFETVPGSGLFAELRWSVLGRRVDGVPKESEGTEPLNLTLLQARLYCLAHQKPGEIRFSCSHRF